MFDSSILFECHLPFITAPKNVPIILHYVRIVSPCIHRTSKPFLIEANEKISGRHLYHRFFARPLALGLDSFDRLLNVLARRIHKR